MIPMKMKPDLSKPQTWTDTEGTRWHFAQAPDGTIVADTSAEIAERIDAARRAGRAESFFYGVDELPPLAQLTIGQIVRILGDAIELPEGWLEAYADESDTDGDDDGDERVVTVEGVN
jgi:hypothetical protein